jgi:hypothetical protein
MAGIVGHGHAHHARQEIPKIAQNIPFTVRQMIWPLIREKT